MERRECLTQFFHDFLVCSPRNPLPNKQGDVGTLLAHVAYGLLDDKPIFWRGGVVILVRDQFAIESPSGVRANTPGQAEIL